MNRSIIETAIDLRMSPAWVRYKIKQGKIKVIRMGNKFYVTQDEINRMQREGVEK